MKKILTGEIISSDPEILYDGVLIELKALLKDLVNNFEDLEELIYSWERDLITDLGINEDQALRLGVKNLERFNCLLNYYQEAYEGRHYIKSLKQDEIMVNAFGRVISFIKM